MEGQFEISTKLSYDDLKQIIKKKNKRIISEQNDKEKEERNKSDNENIEISEEEINILIIIIFIHKKSLINKTKKIIFYYNIINLNRNYIFNKSQK